ncbi:glycosyltransferase family 2 protein [Crocosphaera sp. XPORK-15E]|uniref:glycosyltransferase family 2 protein n=1 Tax=Crocosphaera sp. XPORK-15E TaxID=3110247 RepID=UPI002B2156E0|nr:glycosyltransferase [Crocosphaera sp. XPORK-15E]MEA5533264.1 glycosyltransferase [Crocosphaera sp. XPORK-15E]
MNKKPLISVILCNYNYGQFIGQAIDSVINQTYSNFELIIVDDGSTDDSKKVINSYKDHRIQTVFKENGGQASAFNEGFTVAKGEIISFLDSDDWWKPEKLEIIVKWHNFLEGSYAILQHGLEIWSDGKTKPYKLVLPTGDCFEEMKKTKNIDFFVPTSGLSFPKSILEKIFPLPTEFRICADAYIMRTAFVFGLVYSIPDYLSFYRKHNNTTFKNKNFDHQEFFKTILFPKLYEFYKNQELNYPPNLFEKKFKHQKKTRKVDQLLHRIKLILKV